MGNLYHPTRVAVVAAPLFAILVEKVKPDDDTEILEHAETALLRARVLLDVAHGRGIIDAGENDG